MRYLNGTELVDYIKSRQIKQVRRLRQEFNIIPKLAVVLTVDNPVIDVYIALKQKYAQDILIDIEIHEVKQADAPKLIESLNQDDSIHGIIVQLPLEDVSETETVVNLVSPTKDVDGLGEKPYFDPATPKAILWLINGYGIELQGKKILLVGRGKLVGGPLEKMLKSSEYNVEVADRLTDNLKNKCLEADVIISATGVPGLITADMIKPKSIVVDAGVASEGGKTVGDVADDVYEKFDDLIITPKKGGVGPLTVCSLFDNVIIAAEKVVGQTSKQ